MSVNTILSCELLLHANNLETLEQLVLNGANINYQAENGWCLLFEFMVLNRTTELKHFAKKTLDIHKTDSKGRTAMFWAIHHTNLESVKTLIELDYDIHKDIFPSLPALHYAVYKDDHEIVKLLMDAGIDVKHKDALGQTALSYAQIYERTEIVELFMSHGA